MQPKKPLLATKEQIALADRYFQMVRAVQCAAHMDTEDVAGADYPANEATRLKYTEIAEFILDSQDRKAFTEATQAIADAINGLRASTAPNATREDAFKNDGWGTGT